MKISKTALATALAAMCVIGNSAYAAEVVVDLFTDPAAGHDVSTAIIGTFDTDQAGAFPASIIGGYRDISITKLTDNIGAANQGDATMTAGSGVLSLDNATGVTSRGVITWDGSNAAGNDGASVDVTGLAGYDLTMGGLVNTFLADILYADLGFDYEINVWDMDGSMATLSAGIQFGVPAGVYESHYAFDWFNLPTGQYCDGVNAPPLCANPLTQLNFFITRGGNLGAIDFENIGALQLVLTNVNTASVDFALGKVRAVPEPSILALVGLGLLGMASLGRRKQA
jgi:hypothetical protein